jgi:chromosomal replication initiation ATPase DnaA
MKKNVFNEYVNKVVDLFDLKRNYLFIKSKRKDIVDARHLLYYLCYNRNMQIRYIQEYMADNGYEIGHSSIIYGISQVRHKIDEDVDYQTICDGLA